MLNFVIRNARLPTAGDGHLVDIGFAGGRIKAMSRGSRPMYPRTMPKDASAAAA